MRRYVACYVIGVLVGIDKASEINPNPSQSMKDDIHVGFCSMYTDTIGL